MSYLQTGRLEEAIDSFVLATHFRPRFPEALHNQALAALQRRDFAQAVRCLERALEQSPEFAAAQNTLGYVLTHQTDEFQKGAVHVRKALELTPDDPDVMCNYCAVLTQEGRAAEALDLCETLLARHPDMHEARLNRSFALLKLGRFDMAWADYEARKFSLGNYVPRALPFPEWNGEAFNEGKLLIYAEQGLGDQIMFGSCVADALAHAGGCLVECAPPLIKLFTRSFANAMVIAQQPDDAGLVRTARAAGVTRQVAIGSLPSRFRRRRSDFPALGGYLRADAARTDYWKNRLAALGPGLKVGISWAGGAPSTGGAARSTQLADWQPVLRQAHCHFVNLQYGNAAAELGDFSRAHGVSIHDWRDAIEDYDETAALVTALDLVITVQTALVHLAGALGKPTWVVLQTPCEWRYGEVAETMPWYSSVRLFRQPQPGDWRSVMARIAQDIARAAAS
jgi:tetratricopeptide (TPR) repeat protein